MLGPAEIAMLDQARRSRLEELVRIRRAQAAVRAAERAVAAVRWLLEPAGGPPARDEALPGTPIAPDPSSPVLEASAGETTGPPELLSASGEADIARERHCVECAALFVPSPRVPGQKFCSRACRIRNSNRATNLARKAERRERRNGPDEPEPRRNVTNPEERPFLGEVRPDMSPDPGALRPVPLPWEERAGA